MWDVWFGRDANYSNTQSTPNDSYSSIDDNSICRCCLFYIPTQYLERSSTYKRHWSFWSLHFERRPSLHRHGVRRAWVLEGTVYILGQFDIIYFLVLVHLIPS